MIVGAMTAQAAFVSSGNIYGIINIPIEAGMNAVGISLLPVDPAADPIDVIVPDGLNAGTQEVADSLWIYTGADYYKYYLAPGGVWTDGKNGPEVLPGMGVWVKASAPTTIYQVGLVSDAVSIEIATPSMGATFVANPFPADLDVEAAIDWTDIATAGTANTADRLLVWTGTAYNQFYWFDNGTPEYTGWYSTDNKGRRPPEIPAGEGFFFQRKTEKHNAPIVVNNPF